MEVAKKYIENNKIGPLILSWIGTTSSVWKWSPVPGINPVRQGLTSDLVFLPIFGYFIFLLLSKELSCHAGARRLSSDWSLGRIWTRWDRGRPDGLTENWQTARGRNMAEVEREAKVAKFEVIIALWTSCLACNCSNTSGALYLGST